MRLSLHQAPVALAILATALAALPARASAAAAPAQAQAPSSPRAQLAAECDGLLRAAVKTPYGWGWPAGAVATAPDPTAPPARAARARAAKSVTIDTRTTASAGLALHLASKRLGEPKYSAAAAQAARVLSAVQANTGQIPAAGVIRASAGGNDSPAAVPSRAATCAALALMLTLLHDADVAPPPPEADAAHVRSLRPAALKAANWLATQQTKRGGWPVEYAPSPSEAPGAPGAPARGPRPQRLIRLDRPDARDATFCLWMSAAVLRDARLRGRAEAAVVELSVLRINEEKSPARNLWAAAYDLDETPVQTIEALPYGVDTAATDYAMQSLLAASLLGDGDAAGPVLKEAVDALGKLPKRDGKWLRYYAVSPPAQAHPPGELVGQDPVEPVGPEGQDAAEPVKSRAENPAEAPPESEVFKPGPDAEANAEPTAPPALPQTVFAAGRLADLGPEKYAHALAAAVPVEHRLAIAICGLDEDALTSEPPTDPAGIREYLERYQGEFRLLESPPPDDVATRVQRLGLLLRRVQLEPAGEGAGTKPKASPQAKPQVKP
jgi:hypothetical protein